MNGRIVVSDFDSTIRSCIVDVLTAEGYSVCSYPAGRLQVDDILRELPDLFIAELERADPTATLQFLEQLRRHPLTQAMPILASSTDPQLLWSLEASLGRLNCDTLQKPFKLDQLLKCIAQALARPANNQYGARAEQTYG